MKKFLLSLALVAFAASASMAQTANVSAPQVKKECCKDKAMKAEISRQIVEMNDKYAIDIDAMILYTLHERFGFGKKI